MPIPIVNRIAETCHEQTLSVMWAHGNRQDNFSFWLDIAQRMIGAANYACALGDFLAMRDFQDASILATRRAIDAPVSVPL